MTRIWARWYDDEIYFQRVRPDEGDLGWWWTLDVDEEKLVEWEAIRKSWTNVQNELYLVRQNKKEQK